MGTPIAVVVPSCRPAQLERFLEAWEEELEIADAVLILVEDLPDTSGPTSARIQRYCWRDIDEDLKEDAWIIPRRTDTVRSYGFLKALELGADIIVTLDDDVTPATKGHLLQHLSHLATSATRRRWTSTFHSVEGRPRGFPQEATHQQWPTALSHGLWEGVPDWPADVTPLPPDLWHTHVDQYIPMGHFFPMCGMNLAWHAWLTPFMYFGLQGPSWEYDRSGDMWAGVFVKAFLDRCHYAVWSGRPHVVHARMSSRKDNLKKEASSLPIHELLWQHVDAVNLTGTIEDCYHLLAKSLRDFEPMSTSYRYCLTQAMERWGALTRKAML